MAKIRIKPEPDGIDAAHLADCVSSPGYALIRERMLKQRQQCLDVLVNAEQPGDVRFLQGQIAAIGRSLEIPEILRLEMAAKRRETNAT